MILLPFIPIEFKRFDLSPSTYGYIYAMFAFTNLLVTFIVVRVMDHFGRKNTLLGGVACMTVCMALLVMTSYFQSSEILVPVLFAVRGLQGAATCLIDTSVYAIICVSFTKNRIRYLGLSQSSKGAGSTSGPIIGTLMYSLVGFRGIYFIMTGLFIVLLSLLSFKISKSVDIREGENSWTVRDFLVTNDAEAQKDREQAEDISCWKLLTSKVYLLTTICVFLCFFNFCFYEPVLSTELMAKGLSNSEIGIIFSIAPICYFIMLLIFSFFGEKLCSRKLVVVGMVLGAIGVFLMGPTSFIPDWFLFSSAGAGRLVDSSRAYFYTMGAGHFIMGSSSVLFFLPILPIIIEDGVSKYPNHQSKIADISSAVFNFSLTAGVGVGSIYGSYITQYFGFRKCCTSIALITLLYSLVYLILCVIPQAPPKLNSSTQSISTKATAKDSQEITQQVHYRPEMETQREFLKRA
ncbi:unnamed protein product [Moneuplotes crassus]|uniref:Major facilitator superfamily (MFS) profile domain-containing protein n=1 Tax=Euplotes crassus TaxID=5936 RepID=A0AAD1U2E0_EUPCR|nr:unnamed protein product [Moneuplotes crassus]